MRRPDQIYVFGDFRLDPRRRLLSSRTSGRMVPLSASAFDLLLHLVEQAGTVVSRQSLLSSVWPHATVVENSVNQAVAAIRRARRKTTSSMAGVSTPVNVFCWLG